MDDRYVNRIVNREDGVTAINALMDFRCAVASLRSAALLDGRRSVADELSRVEVSLDVDAAQRIMDSQRGAGSRRLLIDASRFVCVLHGEGVSVHLLRLVQQSMIAWEQAMQEMFADQWSE